ncbi:restriction endonuclease subunit S [Gordonibacter massiliensis (ex Traore et al. 2017)]|uniref:restriction endonuclease subunit S n=1 Tax=Gordonibacter massiliensis (ex Traore et al. 2017) TaxID=1841863 RepID=UPI001C8B8B52|nr:restriction endonuclease subunit S [Gordonibacter massiliensis (ex Traore et al. 2017)]MBX9033709.1 restriction endonuclease subunit S [Gordonibacter massiliensis (ex Traore et al. 2017)]
MKTAILKLKDVCSIRYGKDHKRLPNGSIPCYGSGGIMRFVDTPIHSRPSVLIPRKGTLENLFYVDRPFWTVDTLFWTKVDEDIIRPVFLYYSLKIQDLAELNVGTAVPSLTTAILNEVEIAVPPLEKQDKAVVLLEAFDHKIKLNNRINDYLAEILDVLFACSVEDTNDWSEATLLEIANYKNGLAMQKFRPEENDRGLPVLKIKELNQGFCGADSERCKSDIDSAVCIADGDLVFSWSGTLLLDFWTGGEAGLNQHLFKVTSDAYPSWFYYMWTKYHMRRFIALAKDRATTMGHIKRSALAEAKVLIPPAAVMVELTARMQPLVDEMIARKIEARKLEELRDSLLPKFMSGEIDVSNVDITQLNNHLCDY